MYAASAERLGWNRSEQNVVSSNLNHKQAEKIPGGSLSLPGWPDYTRARRVRLSRPIKLVGLKSGLIMVWLE